MDNRLVLSTGFQGTTTFASIQSTPRCKDPNHLFHCACSVCLWSYVQRPQQDDIDPSVQVAIDDDEEMGGDDGDEGSDGDDDDEESDDEEDEESDDDDEDDDDLQWVDNPKKLQALEELRWSFRTELQDPSAWTLRRVMDLIEARSLFAAVEVVRLWLYYVAQSTCTPQGDQLRLPSVERSQNTPLHRALTWEEADGLVGEDRDRCFGREVEERYKRDARLTILFLFPEANTKGLSTGDKRRIFTIASSIWTIHSLRAEGLLWVLDKEYPNTLKEVGYAREWPNPMSKEFMIYTALFPPPISTSH